MKKVTTLLLLLAAYAGAQSFQGSLRGRVVDPQNAAVAVAKITIKDEAAGVTRATISSDTGEYSFPAVVPATYTVMVEMPGFKKIEQRGVIVSTQSAVTLDLKLEIGQVTEQVNVTAETPLLETANASTGQVIDRQALEDLPNLGRNPFILARLTQTVVWSGNPKFMRMQDQSGSSQISISGGPVGANNYTLDGISITDSTNRATIIPVQEAVQEMKVQANTYDAEMGRTGGGVFNTTLRSGSNQLHGSLFGSIRSTGWLANNFFANRAGQSKPDQPFKNYGGSLGGPIWVPKLYNGQNKTFFFITGEGYRQYDAASSTLSVPTALERVGDYSQSFQRTVAGSVQLMYDPLSTTTAGVRTLFPGNVLPANRISPIGLKMASYYPLPNGASTYYAIPNFTATVRAFNRADQMTFKADHEFFTWFKASASYLHYGSQEPSNRWFPNQVATPNQGVLYRKTDATQLNATLIPKPTTVVTLRFGYNRFPNFTTPISNGFRLTELGLPASVDALTPNYPSFPSLSTGEFAAYGGGTTSQSFYYSSSFNATVTKFVGKHNLKIGYDYRALHHDGAPAQGPTSFSFSDVFTRQRPTAATTGTGGGLATMLLGYPTGGSMTLGTKFYNYVNYHGFFVQDDWRATPKLTLNFGFRGEHEGAPQDKNDKYLVGFDVNLPSPLQANVPSLKVNGALLYAGVNGNPRHAYNPMSIKSGPRFGFAYSPTAKTAVRGGYGIFWSPQSFSFQSATGYSQTTSIITSVDNNFTPYASLNNPYPTGLIQPVGNSLGGLASIGQSISPLDRAARSAGYVQQMSFDGQYQATASTVASIGYIGSHSLDLPYDRQINQLTVSNFALGSALNTLVANPFFNNGGLQALSTANVARSQLLLPFPQYTSVTLNNTDMGRAYYYALYWKVQKRMSNGMTLLATHTWSRNMNLFGSPQDSYDIVSRQWSRSTNNTPHRMSIATTYELPFGKGKKLVNKGGVLDQVIGGWTINAMGQMQSGYPLSISQTNNNTGTNSGQRPNATGLSPTVDKPIGDRINGWINLAAFSQAPAYTFGNLSPTISMRGPSQFNWDASVFKTFTLFEGLKAQFRAEALNVTNTVLFSDPTGSINSNSFGAITSQRNFPRLIQLGVKILR
jgi:hypothetical protein